MSVKIRANLKKGLINVRSLIKHPMETGLRKNKKTGKLIPANYITQVTIKHNDKIASVGEMSTAVSKNPFIGLKLRGEKGDFIELSYVDNNGKTGSGKAKVK